MLQTINKCVINLPERTDRLESIKGELPYLFQDPSFHLVPGVPNLNPMLGIAEAHLNCIRKAKESQWPNVLIMEDDCYFPAKEKTLAYVKNAFNHIPEDWDILLGGLYESNGLTQVDQYWNKTKEFCGLHWYIVHERIYDRLLAYEGRFHIDRWINMSGELNCYVTAKLFALQRDGFSDNVKQRVSYADRLTRFQILK